MTTANIIDLSGNAKGEIVLPEVFSEIFRPDLIKKAVLSAQANRLQPYGTKLYSGMQTSARSWGSGRGVAQVPRIVNGSRVARVPQAVGGRRAHPPKTETDRTEKINKKEKRLAVRSAIAATIDADLVKARGHKFTAEVPFVADDAIEGLVKIKEVISFLQAAGLYDDIIRAKEGKHIRAGKGKRRGRKYKNRKSVLIITGDESPLNKAANNLPGVDVATVTALNAELLAPGTHAGRLTVWTQSAITNMEGMFL